MGIMWRRKNLLRALDVLVYLTFASITIWFIVSDNTKSWLANWQVFWSTALLAIAIIALSSMYHILKRSRPLKQIGIHPNNRQMCLYATFWIGATSCIIVCTVLMFKIQDSAVDIYDNLKVLDLQSVVWPLSHRDYLKIIRLVR